MAQNITLMVASYQAVPAVTLPQTGGGTASFTDVTDTTATASDVAQGKYFHLATGERVAGTASGGGGDTYTLTTVVPQQTFTPQEISGSYQTTVTYTAGLEDGEYYLVTFDGTEYVCECGLYWSSDYLAGQPDIFWSQPSAYVYPFSLGYTPSVPEFSVGTLDLNQHSVKVEHLEFVDGPLNLIAKSVTANGTYSASSDNADGYSSVTVNVPSGGDKFIVTLVQGQDDHFYPDCTYAEAQAALLDNKTLVFFGGDTVSCSYERDSGSITYYVEMLSDAGYGEDVLRLEYLWTSSGATFVGDEWYIIPRSTKTITANGTGIDVARYASVDVAVPSGGSSMNVQTAQSTTRVANTAYTKTASLTCSVSGTYDVYWDCFRSSTSGTSGSQLYIGGSAYGTANTTFASNIHVQTNHLTGVTLAANQEVAVYVRSRATNYYAYCGQLTIVQTA